MAQTEHEPSGDPFAPARERFEDLIGFLLSERASASSAAELEDRLATDGRELVRAALQGHLDLRARPRSASPS